MIFRKLYRLVALIFPLFYYISTKQKTTVLLGTVLCIYVFIEIFRFISPSFNLYLFKHLNRILKEKEKSSISASTYFLISALLTVLLFDKAIAIFCLVSTIIGDASANIIGKKYGRLRIKQKTLEGSIAFFSTAFLAGCLLTLTSLDITLTLVLIGSVIATLIEALPIKLDDNLTVPIGTAFFMMLISKIFTFT